MKTIRALFISLLMLVFVTDLFAQDESSFGGFLASPVGDFKSTNRSSGGFAKPGGGIVFDSKYTSGLLPANWHFYFHSTYQWNDMDTEALGKAFTEALGYRTEVSDSKFSPILTTVGPAYDFRLSKNIVFELKAGIGIMFNNTKAFTVKVYDENNSVIVDQLINFDNKLAFAYNGGAEIKFEIVKNQFAITLFSDYTFAKQTTKISSSVGSTTSLVDSFQKLEYLNTGIKFVLVNKTVAPK
ncbi:MAG: hypothetical protein HOP08_13795 [Cyclobacteriaceae bacterium]|nr:hypothetical protein [Cyclobacteriaceae bacterium]